MTRKSKLFVETEAKRICNNCINEIYLSTVVEELGKRRKCHYCDTTAKTISIEELANKVKVVFNDFYYRTPVDPEGYEARLLADKESSIIGFLTVSQ